MKARLRRQHNPGRKTSAPLERLIWALDQLQWQAGGAFVEAAEDLREALESAIANMPAEEEAPYEHTSARFVPAACPPRHQRRP